MPSNTNYLIHILPFYVPNPAHFLSMLTNIHSYLIHSPPNPFFDHITCIMTCTSYVPSYSPSTSPTKTPSYAPSVRPSTPTIKPTQYPSVSPSVGKYPSIIYYSLSVITLFQYILTLFYTLFEHVHTRGGTNQKPTTIHPVNVSCHYTLWLHPVNTPCQFTLSTHPFHALLILSLFTDCLYYIVLHCAQPPPKATRLVAVHTPYQYFSHASTIYCPTI